MKKILVYTLLLFTLSQCNKIDPVGQGKNAVYLEESSKGTSVQVTIPAGASSSTYNLTPKLVFPVAEDVTISFKTDNGLIDEYNRANGTDYVAIPAANYELANAETIIPAQGTAASPAQIQFNKTDTLSRENKYLLPVTIAQVSSDLMPIASTTTMYYIVDNSVLISTAAVLSDNYFTPDIAGNPNASKLSSMSEFTFEALINPQSFRSPSSEAGISSIMGIEGYLLIRFGDAGLDPNKMQLATTAGNVTADVPVSTNKWTHIAATYDGTTIKLYINGEMAISVDRSLGKINLTSTSRETFYIGRSWNDNRWFDGAISECRIWDVARTAEQLGGDNKYRVDDDAPGLVAYWKFNEGSGNTAADYSGNGFDAIANSNASWMSVKLP